MHPLVMSPVEIQVMYDPDAEVSPSKQTNKAKKLYFFPFRTAIRNSESDKNILE